MSELSEQDVEALARHITAAWLEVKGTVARGLPIALARLLAPAVEVIVARHRAEAAQEALLGAADAWTQGAWADTPRRADRVADRMAASQFAGDWLRDRATQIGDSDG